MMAYLVTCCLFAKSVTLARLRPIPHSSDKDSAVISECRLWETKIHRAGKFSLSLPLILIYAVHNYLSWTSDGLVSDSIASTDVGS